MRLLSHTATHTDDQTGILFFQFLQRANIAKHTLFCMLPHSAGVEQDQIRIFQCITDTEADIL